VLNGCNAPPGSNFNIQFNIWGPLVNDNPIDDDAERDESEVQIVIEPQFDLHSFRPAEIRDVTREYLLEARRLGFREVRLIHGRGRGVQRANVQSLLGELDFVEGFYDDAHLGATVVVLIDSVPPTT
jgi:dsDNA-specific endonuclease/ATPase MutS2